MPVNMSSLKTYVLASLDSEGDPNYYSALVPFCKPFFFNKTGRIFDSSEMVEFLNREYQLNMKESVINIMIDQFVNHNMLQKVNISENNKRSDKFYYLINNVEQSENSGKATEKLEKISYCFKKYLNKVAPNSELVNQEEERTEVLLRWILSMDGLNEGNLRELVSKNYKNLKSDEYKLKDNSGSRLNGRYVHLCSRFILDLNNNDQEIMDDIVSISMIGMAIDIMVDLAKPPKPDRVDLIIALDTDLLMSYVGLSGVKDRDYIRDIVKRAENLNIKFVAFTHNCLELKRNVFSVLNPGEQRPYGHLARALNEGVVRQQFARLAAANPEHIVKKTGIDTLPDTLTHMPNTHVFFDSNAYDEVRSGIFWHPYGVQAAETDAMSIALIARRRQKFRTTDILQSKYILATKNRAFAVYSEKFSIEKFMIWRGDVAPVVHIDNVAAAIWISGGLSERKDISRARLLSACESATSASADTFRKLQDVCKSYAESDVEELEAILSLPRSERVLLDKLAEYSDPVSNADEIIDAVRKSTSLELQIEFDNELEERERNHKLMLENITVENEKKIESMSKTVDNNKKQLNEKLEKKEKELLELYKQMGEVRNSIESHKKILREKDAEIVEIVSLGVCDHVKKMESAVRGGLIFCVIIILIVVFYSNYADVDKMTVSVIAVVLAMISFLPVFFGKWNPMRNFIIKSTIRKIDRVLSGIGKLELRIEVKRSVADYTGFSEISERW